MGSSVGSSLGSALSSSVFVLILATCPWLLNIQPVLRNSAGEPPSQDRHRVDLPSNLCLSSSSPTWVQLLDEAQGTSPPSWGCLAYGGGWDIGGRQLFQEATISTDPDGELRGGFLEEEVLELSRHYPGQGLEMGLSLSMVFESGEILIPGMRCCYSLELSLQRGGAADCSMESGARILKGL